MSIGWSRASGAGRGGSSVVDMLQYHRNSPLLHLWQPLSLALCPIRQSHNGETMKSLVFFSALAATSAIAGAQVKTANPDSTCTKYSDGRIQCRVYRRGSADSLFRR